MDEGWYWFTAVLNFGVLKNSNSTQFIELYFGVLEQIKNKLVQPIGQAAEFKFESKFNPVQVIWQSPKPIKAFDWKFSEKSVPVPKILGQHSGTAWAQTQGIF